MNIRGEFRVNEHVWVRAVIAYWRKEIYRFSPFEADFVRQMRGRPIKVIHSPPSAVFRFLRSNYRPCDPSRYTLSRDIVIQVRTRTAYRGGKRALESEVGKALHQLAFKKVTSKAVAQRGWAVERVDGGGVLYSNPRGGVTLD